MFQTLVLCLSVLLGQVFRGSAEPLTFSHQNSTWKLEVVTHRNQKMLRVEADCPADAWCALGFNDKLPQMDGADVFTFGHHPNADIPEASCKPGACYCPDDKNSRRLHSQSRGNLTWRVPVSPKPERKKEPKRAALRGPGNQKPGPFTPFAHELIVRIPNRSHVAMDIKTATRMSSRTLAHGVVGVAMNSVLMVLEHQENPRLTWEFDDCGGHGDHRGHYHYHIPPRCLLKRLGSPVPERGSWWLDEGEAAWPEVGPEIQVGWALDGTPVYGPYRNGQRVNVADLDECHGIFDEFGNYRYYMVLSPPYLPPCLRGALGAVEGFGAKQSMTCASIQGHSSHVQKDRTGTELVIFGNGCPDHAFYENAAQGEPYSIAKARRMRSAASGCRMCPCAKGKSCSSGCGANRCGTIGCGSSACGTNGWCGTQGCGANGCSTKGCNAHGCSTNGAGANGCTAGCSSPGCGTSGCGSNAHRVEGCRASGSTGSGCSTNGCGAGAGKNSTGLLTTFSGYIIDVKCYQLSSTGGRAPDGSNVIEGPEEHTIHCLRDIPICRTYYLAINRGTEASKNYQVKFTLDEAGNRRALALMQGLPDGKGLKVTAVGLHNGVDGILRDAKLTVCDGGACDGTCSGVCEDISTDHHLLLPDGSPAFEPNRKSSPPSSDGDEWCPCDQQCSANACSTTGCTANACTAWGCSANGCSTKGCSTMGCKANACSANRCSATGCSTQACSAKGCSATGCSAKGCGATGCKASACSAKGCSATGCSATGCSATGCSAKGCGATGCKARGCTAKGCGATGCSTKACSAKGCRATGCSAKGCSATGCKASACSATGCSATGCSAKGCSATGCKARGCAANGCSATGRGLSVTGCQAKGCSVTGCSASGCKAKGCSAIGCQATGCSATGCKAKGCSATGCKANACSAKGCGASGCKARGCSAMGCKANACSAKGCGASGCKAKGCSAEGCGANGCSAKGCSANGCGATGCKAKGCGAIGCKANACSAKGCSTTGSSAKGCGAQGCHATGCSTNGCNASGCNAKGCSAKACSAKACGATGCSINPSGMSGSHAKSTCLCPSSTSASTDTCSNVKDWQVSLGQHFCDKGLITWGESMKATSLAEGNLVGYKIVTDTQQNLVDYSYSYVNGRRKVVAYRYLDTSDPTDYHLKVSQAYYALLAVGSNSLDVGYHGQSAEQAQVCLTTLEKTGNCKAPAEWPHVAPCLGPNCQERVPVLDGVTEISPFAYESVVNFVLRIRGSSPSNMTERKQRLLREAVADHVGAKPSQVSIVGVTAGSIVVEFEILVTEEKRDSTKVVVDQLETDSAMQAFIQRYSESVDASGLSGEITKSASASTLVAKCENVAVGGASVSYAATNNMVRMKVLLKKAAWLAIGFQKEMVGDNVILGQFIGAESTVRHVQIPKKSSELQEKDTSPISAASFNRVNGHSELIFSYPFDSALKSTGEFDVVLAHGSSDNFGYHGLKQRWQLKLALNSCAGAKEKVSAWKKAHGIMMLLAWCVFVPLAILSARFLKGTKYGDIPQGPSKRVLWLEVHLCLNTTAVVITIIAAVLALVKNKDGVTFADAVDSTSRAVAAHLLFGKIILALAALQLIMGFARPHKTESGPQGRGRAFWAFLHKNLGRFLALFAIANCFLGLVAIDWTGPALAVTIALVSIFAVLGLALQVRRFMEAKRHPTSTSDQADLEKTPVSLATC